MVGAAVERGADRGDRRRAGVAEVPRRRVVLERLMMRTVVVHIAPDGRGCRTARATGRAVGIDGGQVEAALEPAPANILGVQEVADILARHLGGRARRRRADIAVRIAVAEHREAALAVGNDVVDGVGGIGAVARRETGRAVGLAGDQVDRAGRGWAEGRAVGIIAHREMLRVIPQRCDGVAVEIAHHQALGVEDASAAGAGRAGVLRKQVHLAAVEGRLLGAVGVILA